MTKLDWNYRNNGEHIAIVGENYRIRAVRDQDAQCPMTDGDGCFPMVIYDSTRSSRSFTTYMNGKKRDNTGPDTTIDLTDTALVLNQHHILKAIGAYPEMTPTEAMRAAIECYLTIPQVGWCNDAAELRELFEALVEDHVSDRARFDFEIEMRYLAGHYAYAYTATGPCQGDQVEVLVIGDPKTIEKFGCEKHVAELVMEVRADPAIREFMRAQSHLSVDQSVEKLKRYIYDRVSEKLLQPCAKTYEDWAYGNVWGYIVEKRVPTLTCPHCDTPWIAPDAAECAECGEETEPGWEELPDGSCWGFFGNDFNESGLAEAAMEHIPDEELADAVS